MTELEAKILKETKKHLRLSCERDLYTIPQAAFRLNISRNRFNQEYVKTGRIKLKLVGSDFMVPASEINCAIDQLKSVVHRSGLRAVSCK